MTEVRFPVPDGDLSGYLAVPEGAGPFPGVVVLHEAFGLTDDIRRQADRLAAEGYVALAPDLYAWGSTARCLVATMRAVTRREGRVYGDITAAREWLAGRDECTDRIGVIGFCMGGGLALVAAPSGAFAAAAPNYGEVPKDSERTMAGACPIVASYGGRDRILKGRAERLEAALTALDVPHDVEEYPEASHSFLNHHSGFPGFLDRITGFGYQEEAAADTWRRILQFFGEHLQGEADHDG